MKDNITLFSVIVLLCLLMVAIPLRNAFAVKDDEIYCENFERVDAAQLEISPDKIIINIDNASISRYANTSSMIPLITENSKGITVKPASPDDIREGDVITYQENGILIVHRVIKIGEDNWGWYCIVKGDNTESDDGKIRFNQIKSILIGVLY